MFSITISKRGDFLKLENAIQKLAGCQSKNCAFFQSAAYVQLRMAVCTLVSGGSDVPQPAVLSIPSTPLLLVLLDDGRTLLVRSTTVFDSAAAVTSSSEAPSAKNEACFLTALAQSRALQC
jgi:hypothetical protein